MTRSISASRPSSGYGVLTMAVLATFLSATGRAETDTLQTVLGWGLPESSARLAIHAAPVVLLVLLLLIVRPLLRGRSPSLRWGLLGGAGVVTGFFMGVCLELFVGVPGLIERIIGPLSATGLIDQLAWIVATLGLTLSLLLASLAMFGRGAVFALQVEDIDEECADVRRSERAVYARSAFAMAALGIACAGLAVARQSEVEVAQLGAGSVAFIAALLSVWANYALWRGFDELQRRIVVNGYAVSAIIVTLGVFVWALAEALAWVPSVDASGVFLALIGVQLCATSYVATTAMGQMSLGKII